MKVLIADDESIVLEGLKYIIDWEKLGFSICSEARNGEETLEKILNLNPELVLLDIKMPKLSGIEIVKLAREHNFSGHFIILSGYSDFSYAQKAIRYGVDFYLTKPIDEEELTESVTKVYETILKERKLDTNLHQYREKAKDTILRHLLIGDEELTSLDFSDLHMNADSYQVVIYERYNQDSFQPFWNFADLLRVTNHDNNSFDHITLEDREIVLLKGEFAMKRFENLLSHYNTSPQKGSPLDSLFLTYGRRVWQLRQIPNSYHDALLLLSRRFFCEANQHVFGYQELPQEEEFIYTINSSDLAYYPKLLSDYIYTYNRSRLADTLKELETNLYYSTDDITTIKHFLIDMYFQIKQNVSHTYSTIDIPFPTNSAIINLIEGKFYLYEIIQFLSEQFEMCMNAIGTPTSKTIMDDILYYIDHNYYENLKLESIAPLFGYNSSYLGKIFTKKVGESFNSYLDRVRIEHSKKLLLEDNCKVYEVAQKVGYKTVDYFHKKFKKYTQMSPAEFRKLYQK